MAVLRETTRTPEICVAPLITQRQQVLRRDRTGTRHRSRRIQGRPRPLSANPLARSLADPVARGLSSAAVQEVAECAAGGNQRSRHQVDRHPGDAREVAWLVFDVGAGDGQSGEERHPSRRGQ